MICTLDGVRKISKEAESLTGQELADYVNQNQKLFKAAPSKLSMEKMKAKLMDVKYVMESAEEAEELIIDAEIPESCEGGYPIEAWRYWVKTGICTGGSYESQSGCKPYPIPPCGHHPNQTYYGPCPTNEYDTPVCTNKCIAGYKTPYADDKHYGTSAYNVAKTVAGIQKEIMTNGPVEAAYTVYEDFYQYTGGVYTHTGGAEVGGHAVRILGWGVDNKTPYWLVANSWNTDWGENGYFRILRGVNECGIEHAIVAGLPKV
ncbi:unnamed protein product [Haemonchus placei]|uniref:Pept_C1 domain-containing protein n=1 Tax=Haemonchus placei TaxID=6290 RepID=A0A0N4WV45_HAEPC|nr:unnamed protein product [Haemonchus placei]